MMARKKKKMSFLDKAKGVIMGNSGRGKRMQELFIVGHTSKGRKKRI